MTLPTTSRSLLTVLILVFLAPASVQAQRRGRAAQAPTGAWAPISVGLHGGYDNTAQGAVLGAQIRAPIVRSGKVEIMPSGSVTFVDGLREYQFNLDAVYVTGGQSGGLYVAGGLAGRNTKYGDEESVRETRMGGSAAVGIRGGSSAVAAQLEVRQTYLDADFRPMAFTLGLNFPLWGRRR